MNKFQISLSDLHFYSRHGVFAQEHTVGNEFTVDCSVMISADKFIADDDNLDLTISYADIFEVIKAEMDSPKRLLETVAVRIANSLKQKFPEIESGHIEIVKLAPPIPGIVGKSSVKYFF